MSNTNFNEIYSKVISSKYLKKTYDSFSISTLISKSGQNLFLPFYHTVSNKRLPHIENIYPVRNEKLFIEDLDLILKYFEPVSIYEVENKVQAGETFKKPSFHLTFDDGLSEIYSVVAPILEKKGIPATFFVNTDFIDNKALFYRYKVSLIIEKLKTNRNLLKPLSEALYEKIDDIEDVSKALLCLNYSSIDVIDKVADKIELSFDNYLTNEAPYLSTNQIKELIKKEFTIGSHSIDHPFFDSIPIAEQKKQINESFRLLVDKFAINYKFFSFPFSDEGVTIDLFDWLYDVEKCNLSFGTSGLKQDYSVQHIHRVAFDGTLNKAEDIVKLQYFNYIVKSMMNKNYVIRL